MKKLIAIVLVFLALVACVGCTVNEIPDITNSNSKAEKLIELDGYSDMRKDGTTSIDVSYTYVNGEEHLYDFVIEENEIIEEIMATVFELKLEKYPEDRDINFYYRYIVIHQGNQEYSFDLGYVSDGGQRYLCKSQELNGILENYIEGNFIK